MKTGEITLLLKKTTIKKKFEKRDFFENIENSRFCLVDPLKLDYELYKLLTYFKVKLIVCYKFF